MLGSPHEHCLYGKGSGDITSSVVALCFSLVTDKYENHLFLYCYTSPT